MTRSTEGLPQSEYKILAVLRRIIPDGETRQISQADIARRARVSEGTVSPAMRALEARGYLERERPTKFVRGSGYAITIVPLPEVRGRAIPRHGMHQKGSESDPTPEVQVCGFGTPQTGEFQGSNSDPSNNHDHVLHEQQQHTPPTSEKSFAEKLTEQGAHPRVIERILAHPQNQNVAAFLSDLAAASERRGVEDPLALTLEVWAAGQRVRKPRGRRVPEQPAPKAQIDPARYRAAPGFGVGDDEPAEPEPEPEPEPLPEPEPEPCHAVAPAGDWQEQLRMQMGRAEWEAAIEGATLLRCEGQSAIIGCRSAAQKTALERSAHMVRSALGVGQITVIIQGGRR
jgi:hypothetical protein